MKVVSFTGILMTVLTFICSNADILAQTDSSIAAQNENVLNGPIPFSGGKVKASGNYYIELVFLPSDTSSVHIHLFDAKAVPVSNIGITGIIVIHNYNNSISSFDLIQYKEDEFIINKHVSSYKQCDITLEVKGGSISAKFYPN
jgi:hypothetical protein